MTLEMCNDLVTSNESVYILNTVCTFLSIFSSLSEILSEIFSFFTARRTDNFQMV